MPETPESIPGRAVVLVLTPWFPNSPGEREGNFVHDSALATSELGYAVHVLVARPRSLPGLSGSASPAPIRTGTFSGVRSVRLVRHLSIPRNVLPAVSDWSRARALVPEVTRVIGETRATIVHAHTEAMAPIAIEGAHASGARVAVTVHGVNTDPNFLKGGRRRRYGDALAKSDRVIIVGESLKAYVAGLAGRADHLCVVPNGFHEYPACRQQPALRDGHTVHFVSVSNLNPGKGVDVNLAALGQLRRAGRVNWTYTIVGGGVQAATLRETVRELGLEPNVRFTGYLAPREVARELGAADVFVLPSSPEAFGIAYLEAMAAGCLAIGARGEGPSSFIRHGTSGLLVDAGDAQSLARLLERIVHAPEAFRAIATEGGRVARVEYTWARHAKALSSVYDELQGRRH